MLTENEIKLEQYGFSNNSNVESVILFAVEFTGFFVMISREVFWLFRKNLWWISDIEIRL